jgi:hypothetical protein
MRNSRSRKLIRLTLGEAIQPTGPGMPEGHQDQQPVANRVAAVAGSGKQGVDLFFRQVLALPNSVFLPRPVRTVRLFRLREQQLDNRIH